MKVFGIAAGLLVVLASFSARAEVKAPGTFVPTDCGEQAQIFNQQTAPENGVTRLCLGYLVSEDGGKDLEAVLFRFDEGEEMLFKISRSRRLPQAKGSTARRDVFFLENKGGHKAVMSVTFDDNGEPMVVAGQVNERFPFYVDQLETIFTTMTFFPSAQAH